MRTSPRWTACAWRSVAAVRSSSTASTAVVLNTSRVGSTLEVGRVQAQHQRSILGQANEVVRNIDEGAEVISERAGPLALLQEGVERRNSDAPRLARLETLQASVPAPAMNRRRLHPESFGDVLDSEELLTAVRVLAHGCRRRGTRSAHQDRLRPPSIIRTVM